MIRVYSLHMNRTLTANEREAAMEKLTPERKTKVQRFRRLEAQQHCIATGLLEDYAIRKEFHRRQQDIEDTSISYVLEKGPEGKPYVRDYPDLHYNISHAGSWVVCAIGDQPMGIDVESKNRYTESVVKRFFQPDEITEILEEEDPERKKDIFADYWVMKESFMKLSGGGFSVGFHGFYCDRQQGNIKVTEQIPEQWCKVLKDMGVSESKEPVCLFLPLEPEYHCAVCTVGRLEGKDLQHQILTLDDIL